MRKLLLGSAIAVALLTGCGDDKKESSQSSTQEIKKEETVNNTQNPTSVEKVKETTQKIEEVKETTTTLVQKKENVIIAPDKVEGEIKEITTQAAVETSTIDVNTLFKTCASCHGEKAEKLALGKSQVIAGWNKEKLITAMNGYKDGSYGGVMKNIMKSQVSTKTDSEIDALAEFISKL